MNAVPTGVYQPGSSFLHRLCAFAKLLCLIVLLCAVVATGSLSGYALLLLFTAGLLLLSCVPLRSALGSVWRLRWFFLIILLMNTCFFSPEGAWFSLWIFTPSPAGLMQGLNVVLRVLFILVFSNLLTLTTAPMELTGAIELLLSPLGLLKIPVGQVAMILSVAIQFVPALFEETDMIRKAQTARGAKFDSPRLLDKAGAAAPLVVPIFLAAFKRADELALAMEARGYRTDAPSRPGRRLSATWRDAAALVCCCLLWAVQILYL